MDKSGIKCPFAMTSKKLLLLLQFISLFNPLFMAKQAGAIFIEGTIDDLTFYKMCGKYYVRMKTSLTGKRFWKDKTFEGSRKSCSRFSEGNKLASIVFRLVREEKRTNRLFPFLRTKAIALLKEGREKEEVIQLLLDFLVDFGCIEIKNKPAKNSFTNRESYEMWLARKKDIISSVSCPVERKVIKKLFAGQLFYLGA